MPSKIIAFLSFIILLLANAITSAHAQTATNIAYGSLDRQKYDVYAPGKITDKTSILFFLYGGSWESGKKESYSFVGKAFAKEGFITVIPDYRLYPDVSFPSFVEDAALAFAKVRQQYPNKKIFISGHSAGAQIGSLLTLDTKYLKAHGLSPCGAISGFIGLAGPYDFQVTEEKFKRIFPEATRPQSQAVNFAGRKAPSTLLLHGAADYTVHAQDSTILANKMRAAGSDAQARIYPGVGHINIVSSLVPLLGLLAPTKKDMVEFMREKSKNKSGCN